MNDIRSAFPALAATSDVLLDNAGGSQVPAVVADAIRDYMLTNYVQLGADYETAKRSTAVVADAHDFINLFMNGQDSGKVMLLSATTVLCNMLADCYGRAPQNGRDEIIVAQTSHEANAGGWYRLADRGFTVRTWPVEPDTLELNLNTLRSMLNGRTRIVAFPHVCNVLGRIEDAQAMTKLAHDAGARVVIDGVAYAPHRAIDVKVIGADWYVYSTYKVFGPHLAALFGTHDAIAELEGPNYFFIPKDDVPYKLEPGGPAHESCAGLLALWRYLATVTHNAPDTAPRRDIIEQAYARFTELEDPLQLRLLDYLRGRDDLRIIGPAHSGPNRVPTISFVHKTRRSRDIVLEVNAKRYGIRYGHFCCYRMCERLANEGVLHELHDGVVRASALHYNTIEEIDGLIECFEQVL
jgi:cysteine desulfurase family protein (TIGR01976 family)